MAWINGQWVEDRPAFGGMLGGFGSLDRDPRMVRPGFQPGGPNDPALGGPGYISGGGSGSPIPPGVSPGTVIDGWNPLPLPPTPPTWTQGPPFMPGPQPPFGDRPGMPNLPPQMNPPGYSRGPQMQAPFGGGLGNIDQWNPAQPGIAAQYQPPQLQSLPDMRARAIAEAQAAARMPAPQVRPPMPVSPPYRPPMPPPPPNIDDVWEPMPPPRPPVAPPEIIRPPIPPRPPVLPPDIIYDPPPVVRPRTDHEFNVAQREKTKARLAQDRAKTKKHYATLRAKGASPKTIAKAKAKSKARSKKIKGQSLRRTTIKN